MKKLKVVQIGVGHDHATMTMETMLKNPDVFEVAGYVVVPEDWRNVEFKGVHRFASVEEALSVQGLDAAVIESDEHVLTKYALMAAKRGLHVQMDKPGGADTEEFSELIRTVKEKNVAFNTGYMYRFNPAVKEIKRLIKSGELGEIYSVETQMNVGYDETKRRWVKKFGNGGMLYFLGCHLIDLVYSIMGEPESIIPLTTGVYEDRDEIKDFGMVVYKYKNGVSFAKTTCCEQGGANRRQLVVCGTKGTCELKPIELPSAGDGITCDLRTVIQKDNYKWWDAGTTVTYGPFHRYEEMLLYFAECARGERVNEFTPDYELKLHGFIMRSCAMKSPVTENI